MIDSALTIKKLKNLYDFCYELKDPGIDLEAIEGWQSTTVDAFIVINKYDPELNYMKAITSDFLSCDQLLTKLELAQNEIQNDSPKSVYVGLLTNHFVDLNLSFEKLKFNLGFFKQLNFFDNNIVIVGANGSGKTSLADSLRTNLNNNGLVISAQRVLFIPEFESIPNVNLANERWSVLNKKSRTFKDIEDFLEIKEEFGYSLSNLIAKHNQHSNDYLEKSNKQFNKRQPIVPPKNSELQDALKLWNNIFDHRQLHLTDGKITACVPHEGAIYEAIRLSEGEKATLYLTCQVIQAPSKGFIIIDEPEMYLHKTIISRLWNNLEQLRDDCIFIYLTHDLDFATSRNTAKKVWIKSFEYPTTWNIEEIPDNAIPEGLLLELLGSRKNILFCEGVKGSLDETIYKILFPNITLIPVESCLNVINFTKAYNKIPIVHTKAFGLIDSDYHAKERLDVLVKDHIYNFQMAEIENIFLIEEYLKILSEYLHVEISKLKEFKTEVLIKLANEKENQCARFVSCKINDYFKDCDITSGKNQEAVTSNFDKFKTKIEIDEWFKERSKAVDDILNSRNYQAAIGIFNNKGLQSLADRFFTRNFIDFSVKHIAKHPNAQTIVKRIFPPDLLEVIDKAIAN